MTKITKDTKIKEFLENPVNYGSHSGEFTSIDPDYTFGEFWDAFKHGGDFTTRLHIPEAEVEWLRSVLGKIQWQSGGKFRVSGRDFNEKLPLSLLYTHDLMDRVLDISRRRKDGSSTPVTRTDGFCQTAGTSCSTLCAIMTEKSQPVSIWILTVQQTRNSKMSGSPAMVIQSHITRFSGGVLRMISTTSTHSDRCSRTRKQSGIFRKICSQKSSGEYPKKINHINVES